MKKIVIDCSKKEEQASIVEMSQEDVLFINSQKTLYTELRLKEYPDMRDQLDVIWKQLNSDRLNGKALDQETDDMLGKILNIKKKYPKED